MNDFTVQDYQNAKQIRSNWQSAGCYLSLADYLEENIAKLEKPAPKRYRCISDAWPFNKGLWTIGEVVAESAVRSDYAKFPFHFERIEEPVKPKPISMQDVLYVLADACFTGDYQHRVVTLMASIRESYNL